MSDAAPIYWIYYFYPMQEIFDKANAILDEINALAPADAAELEQFRIKYLGSKGILKELFGFMAQLPGDRKKEYGQLMNTLKAAAETKIETLKNSFQNGNTLLPKFPT